MSFKSAAKATGRGTKSFFSAVGTVLEAAAEASAERNAAIAEHEQKMRESDAAIVALGGKSRLAGNTLPWSLTQPGHLVSCHDNCRTKHCLDCGNSTLGSNVRCTKCW